jgi:hypothetical protein
MFNCGLQRKGSLKDSLIGLASVMVSTRSYQQSEEYLRRAAEMLGGGVTAGTFSKWVRMFGSA